MTASESARADALPPKPEPPLDSDCCGNGCEVCVWTLHEEALERWRAEVRARSAGSAGADAGR